MENGVKSCIFTNINHQLNIFFSQSEYLLYFKMSLKLSHKYLQQLCRENKASTCGTKQELIDRLLAKNEFKGMKPKITNWFGISKNNEEEVTEVTENIFVPETPDVEEESPLELTKQIKDVVAETPSNNKSKD